jgi:AraC-like DNA-binding protein/mannose-6-phosphate isomerase-like protein (cupin superfamily)
VPAVEASTGGAELVHAVRKQSSAPADADQLRDFKAIFCLSWARSWLISRRVASHFLTRAERFQTRRYIGLMVEGLFQPFPMPPGRRAQPWRHQPSFRRPRHFHPEHELNIVLRGQARMGIGGSVAQVGSGDVLLFHPGQDHVLLEGSPDLDLFVMALRPELAARRSEAFARVTSSGCHLPEPTRELLEQRLSALANVADNAAVEHHLLSLFVEMTEHLTLNHVLSRRALQELSSHPESSGSALASRLGVHPSVLSRRFHEDLQMTFVDYRAHQRAMAFVRLVDAGSSLTSAALEAGFGSYAQCHRVISKALGCQPQRYFAGERRRIDAARFEALPAARPGTRPRTAR